MPVTAKLSRMFYEKMGDEVTNELVDWLNSVDLSYRQEFRELFEAHFGRLGAEMRVLDGSLRGEMRHLEDHMRAEMKQLEVRLDGRIRAVETEIGQLARRSELKELEERLRGEIKAQKAELVAWMFLFRTGTVAATKLLS